MAVVFMEGFEQYGDLDDLTRRWHTSSQTNMSLVAGRFTGGQAVECGLNGGDMQIIIPQSANYLVGFAFKITSTIPGSTTPILSFHDWNVSHVDISVLATGELRAVRSITTLGTTSGLGLVADTWYYIEVRVVISNTVGEVEIQVDGVQELNLTSQDTLNGSTGADYDAVHRIRFHGNTTERFVYDDIYILDNTGAAPLNTFLYDGTDDIAVETKFPDANGDTNNFTASPAVSNYLNVDDGGTPDDDTSYNHSSTLNHSELYGFEALDGFSGTVQDVLCVGVTNLVRKSEAGDRTIRNIARNNVTTVEGAAHALPVEYFYHNEIFATNPDGGGAWTEAAVNSSQFGLTIEA